MLFIAAPAAARSSSYHIIQYHIVSYRIVSYHIIPYHIISYHIISYHIIGWRLTCAGCHRAAPQRPELLSKQIGAVSPSAAVLAGLAAVRTCTHSFVDVTCRSFIRYVGDFVSRLRLSRKGGSALLVMFGSPVVKCASAEGGLTIRCMHVCMYACVRVYACCCCCTTPGGPAPAAARRYARAGHAGLRRHRSQPHRPVNNHISFVVMACIVSCRDLIGLGVANVCQLLLLSCCCLSVSPPRSSYTPRRLPSCRPGLKWRLARRVAFIAGWHYCWCVCLSVPSEKESASQPSRALQQQVTNNTPEKVSASPHV